MNPPISCALRSFALRGNRMQRTDLAGVTTGIAAVIVMVSIGQGTQSEIDKMASGLPAAARHRRRWRNGAPVVRAAQGSCWSLSEGDVDAIRARCRVQYVSVLLRGGTQVVYAENKCPTQWQGVQPDWFTINDWQIAKRRRLPGRRLRQLGKPVIIGETVRAPCSATTTGSARPSALGGCRSPWSVC